MNAPRRNPFKDDEQYSLEASSFNRMMDGVNIDDSTKSIVMSLLAINETLKRIADKIEGLSLTK